MNSVCGTKFSPVGQYPRIVSTNQKRPYAIPYLTPRNSPLFEVDPYDQQRAIYCFTKKTSQRWNWVGATACYRNLVLSLPLLPSQKRKGEIEDGTKQTNYRGVAHFSHSRRLTIYFFVRADLSLFHFTTPRLNR